MLFLLTSREQSIHVNYIELPSRGDVVHHFQLNWIHRSYKHIALDDLRLHTYLSRLREPSMLGDGRFLGRDEIEEDLEATALQLQFF